jgi:hypothetical protein
MQIETLSDQIRRRAAGHSNAALRAQPGSVERAMEERLDKECREIADFIKLNHEN